MLPDLLSGAIVGIAASVLIAAGAATRRASLAGVIPLSRVTQAPPAASIVSTLVNSDWSSAATISDGASPLDVQPTPERQIGTDGIRLTLGMEADWQATQIAIVQARQQARLTEPASLHVLDSEPLNERSYLDIVGEMSTLRILREKRAINQGHP